MGYNPADTDLRNEDRRLKPVPGDCWNERMGIVLIVLEVADDYVTIAEDRVEANGGYRFDYSKAKVLTRQEFSRKPCYGGTGGLKDKCWCDVSAYPSSWVLSDWHEWLSESGNTRPVYVPPLNRTSIRDMCR